MQSLEPKASPYNSRYIPLTQQAACCVPTCMQMVMYKEGIPLVAAEEIGYRLGLIVHPNRSKLFYNVRAATEAPPAGYGTQISSPKYEPNAAFKKLGIPLGYTFKPITDFATANPLLSELADIETSNGNALLCFNHGALVNDDSMNWGHVCVFDRVIDGEIRIIDPSPDQPKWRLIDPEKMFDAMQQHGVQNSAGIWLLTPNDSTHN